ncbi:MAG: nicotinamide mononucleotide transporter [Candidatus Staskawiczbacteria bacterium]|jgi:nicotinamide riboside transporter PnuC
MWSLDIIANIGVAILGITAIILVAKKNKWGWVIGLSSQPFWLITSYINEQWGVFILTIVYIFTWSFGIYEWFSKDKK